MTWQDAKLFERSSANVYFISWYGYLKTDKDNQEMEDGIEGYLGYKEMKARVKEIGKNYEVHGLEVYKGEQIKVKY